ncbi:hypothetical protein IKG07_01385 [Candidatus Saccharibacteria bacterium]|nr:hypothetical protein [Candidatus Saccharibacteria bacterium]
MAETMNKVVYYHSLLNFLNVVEFCRRNLRKDLKEDEYNQAFAILDYNSQWVKLAPLSKETKEKLLKAAKDPETRERLREIIKKIMPKRGVASVEDLLKEAGE